MRIVIALAAVLLLALGPLAEAADKSFTWTAPTTYTDGTALPSAEIANYALTCSPSGSQAVVPKTQPLVKAFPPGTYACTLAAVATNGQASAQSNAVNFTVPQPAPSAPTGFSVN
jgi:hypothetical protein